MCQLDVIRECKSIKLLRRALKTLPKTLDETYERVLSNIPDDYVEDARRVLQCLICAFEPLDIREVAEIVAIDTAEPYYHPEGRYSNPRETLSVCCGLVSTRTSKRRCGPFGSSNFEIEELRFAHFSVKEYLVSDRVNLGPASKYNVDEVSCHMLMADLCISYLLQFKERIYDKQSGKTTSVPEAEESWEGQSDPEADGHCEDLKLCESSPFAPYAAVFWSTHFRAAKLDNTTPLYPKSMKLVADPALVPRTVNYHRFWYDSQPLITLLDLGIIANSREHVTYLLNASLSPVYYASLLGLDHHVSQLLEAGESANSMGPSGTALVVAAWKGHKSTVQLLLKMSANVNAQKVWKKGTDGTTILFMTALHSAIAGGHEDIAHLLLHYGAAVNTQLIAHGDPENVVTNTPLQDAVSLQSTSLVQNLVDRGADITVAGGLLGDALEIACSVRDANLARLLFEKGANPSRYRHLELLEHAIMTKNEPLQQVLVEYGADVALVDFDDIRYYMEYGEDYIVQTEARLAQVERRPKPSIATPDSVG